MKRLPSAIPKLRTLVGTRFIRAVFLLSLGVVTVFPLLDKLFIYPRFTALIVENTADEAKRVAQYTANTTGLGGYDLGKGSLPEELVERVRLIERDLSLEKLKIYSAAGEVLYSTDPKDLGTVNRERYFREVIGRAEPSVGVVRRGAESLEGQPVTSDVVETYIPIMRGGEVVGAFEIYYDVTARLTALDRLLWRSSALLLVVSMALFGTVLVVFFKAAGAEAACQEANGELLKAERYLESLVRSSPDAIISNNRPGDISFFSPGAEALLGYEKEEVIGRHVATLYDSEKRAKEVMSRMRQGGGAVSAHESVLRAKDGTLIPVLISASILYDESGKEVAVVGFNKDLRGRKRAEEETQKSYQTQAVLNAILKISLEDVPLKEQLERALDVIIAAPFMALKPRGGIFLLGDAPGVLELKAHRGLSLSHRQTCAQVPFGLCHCGRAASSGRIGFSQRLDHNHETRYEGIEPHGHYIVPILSRGRSLGVIVLYLEVGHLRDRREEDFLQAVASTLAGVIERKRAEDALNEAHKELQRAYNALEKAQASAITVEKLAALGRLTAGATHEILNPLNIINLVLHMMIDESDLPEETLQDLRTAKEQVERIETITKGLLHFSRRQPPKRRRTDVNEVVRRAVTLVSHELKLCEIAVELNTSDGLPPVLADPDQLQQVLINLLTNARDAMPEGGRLTLSTAVDRSAEGEWVVLRVEDTGEGIPTEHMDKLFEPFFTTKAEEKGTGLGLAICQGIVGAHGGAIWAENLPSGGAAFVVRLSSFREEET